MSMQEREWSCLQKVERTGRAGRPVAGVAALCANGACGTAAAEMTGFCEPCLDVLILRYRCELVTLDAVSFAVAEWFLKELSDRVLPGSAPLTLAQARLFKMCVLAEFSPLHALNKIPAERALALCTGRDDQRDLPLADFGRCGVADFALNRERRAGLMSSMPGRVHAGVSVVGQQESDDDLLRAEDWSPEQLTHGNGLVWLGVLAFVVLLGFLTGRR